MWGVVAMLKTNKYRIYPNKEQVILINKTFGCIRFVYNKMLRFKQELYNQTLMNFSKTECNNWCNRVLKEDYSFLKEVDKFSLTNAIYNLDSAYQKFFKEHTGFPNYKSKKESYKSYTTNYTNNNIVVDYDNNKIKLPKLGNVSTRVHRKLNGNIKDATVSKTPTGKYFVSITYECNDNKVLSKNNKNVGIDLGIDLGIKDLCITSDGKTYENPKHLRKYERRLARLQRQLAKKIKKSNNFYKKKKQIALCHEKIVNIRRDYLHKISHEIVNDNQVIITENLKIKDMMQDKHLARSIADVSWHEFVRQLEYKSAWYGRTFLKVNTYYASSQLCHVCGYQNSKTKDLSVRVWTCSNCHTTHNRDINAAKNILQEGLRLLA